MLCVLAKEAMRTQGLPFLLFWEVLKGNITFTHTHVSYILLKSPFYTLHYVIKPIHSFVLIYMNFRSLQPSFPSPISKFFMLLYSFCLITCLFSLHCFSFLLYVNLCFKFKKILILPYHYHKTYHEKAVANSLETAEISSVN